MALDESGPLIVTDFPRFDRALPVPLHRQVSASFRSKISSGRWQPHYRLQAEPDLASELGISRGTLRRAISTLVDEGLLVHMRGRGTFVTSTVIEPSIGQKLSTLAEDFASLGIDWSTTVLDVRLTVAPPAAASLLDIPVGGMVFQLTREGRTNTEAVAYLVNFVRADLAPGIEAVDFSATGLFTVLEHQYGLVIESGRRTFSAVPAPVEVSSALDIDVGTPMQYLEQITYLADGQPIEYSDVWIDSRKLRVTSLLSRR